MLVGPVSLNGSSCIKHMLQYNQTISLGNHSGLLVAYGDELILVVRAGLAAVCCQTRSHHQTPANCRRVPIYLVECQFIEHVTCSEESRKESTGRAG